MSSTVESRRDFFRRIAAVTGAGVGVLAYPHREEIIEALMPYSVKDFSSPEGGRFRGIFYVHGNESLGMEPQKVQQDDLIHKATMFETGDAEYLDLPPKGFTQTDVSPAILHAIKEAYTTFGSDPDIAGNFVAKSKIILADFPGPLDKLFLSAAPSVVAFVGGEKLIKKSRRNVLKALGGAFAIWGSTLFFASALLPFGQSAPEEYREPISRVDFLLDRLHPEFTNSLFRESIIAYKLRNLGTDTNIVMGGMHWTIPWYFQLSKEEHFEIIKSFPDILKEYNLDGLRKYSYTSVIVGPVENGELLLETVEDQELKDLFETKE